MLDPGTAATYQTDTISREGTGTLLTARLRSDLSLLIPRTLYVQTVYGKRGDLSIIVQKIAGNWWQIVSACVRWPDNSAPCIHSPALDISCHTQQHAHCGATCPVAGI